MVASREGDENAESQTALVQDWSRRQDGRHRRLWGGTCRKLNREAYLRTGPANGGEQGDSRILPSVRT